MFLLGEWRTKRLQLASPLTREQILASKGPGESALSDMNSLFEMGQLRNSWPGHSEVQNSTQATSASASIQVKGKLLKNTVIWIEAKRTECDGRWISDVLLLLCDVIFSKATRRKQKDLHHYEPLWLNKMQIDSLSPPTKNLTIHGKLYPWISQDVKVPRQRWYR